jgi:hypothetical protein
MSKLTCRHERYGMAAHIFWERFLIVTVTTFALASCASGPAQSPYDQDCSASSCNGHMMPNSVGPGL